jgi:hypothetical protein
VIGPRSGSGVDGRGAAEPAIELPEQLDEDAVGLLARQGLPRRRGRGTPVAAVLRPRPLALDAPELLVQARALGLEAGDLVLQAIQLAPPRLLLGLAALDPLSTAPVDEQEAREDEHRADDEEEGRQEIHARSVMRGACRPPQSAGSATWPGAPAVPPKFLRILRADSDSGSSAGSAGATRVLGEASEGAAEAPSE